MPWIPFGDHPLKLERYREDEHGHRSRLTRTSGPELSPPTTKIHRSDNTTTKIEKDGLRGSSVKIGTIQMILAWPPRKDDTHKPRGVTDLNYREYWDMSHSEVVANVVKQTNTNIHNWHNVTIHTHISSKQIDGEVVFNVVLSTLILITGIKRLSTVRNKDIVLKFWVARRTNYVCGRSCGSCDSCCHCYHQPQPQP